MSKQKIAAFSVARYACIALIAVGCSGLSRLDHTDRLGRVASRAVYTNGVLRGAEEIRYVGESARPLSITFRCLKRDALKPSREAYHEYTEAGMLVRIRYTIVVDGEKIPCGSAQYAYGAGNTLRRITYTALSDTVRRRTYPSGVQMFEYSGGRVAARRIIEYAYNRKTNAVMQIGQHAISYHNAAPALLQSWVLDPETGVIARTRETNGTALRERITRIETALAAAASGVHFTCTN